MDNLVTHLKASPSFDMEQKIAQIKNNTNLNLSQEQTLELLKQLHAFELGRSLLVNGGLDGYWIAYVISYAYQKENLHPLEDWIVHNAPLAIATRQRFHTFQREIEKRLHDHMQIASIPCGLMDDLLTLDEKSHQGITLTGIDLDHTILVEAASNAQKHNKTNISFSQQDAWNLKDKERYDLVCSNGLSIYVSDYQKSVALYKNIAQTLKKNGTLITSFLTPPPALDPKSPWSLKNPADALKQKAIFVDILQAKFNAFWSQEQMQSILNEAGFMVKEIIYDEQKLFPTVIAHKIN